MSSIDFSSSRLAGAALAVLALAAAGCTVQVVMPEVPASHPAHPDAASAPLPEPSPLLDSYRPVAPPPDLEPMSHGDVDHGEMNHEGMNHGDMNHDTMGDGEMDHEATDHQGMDHGEMDHEDMEAGEEETEEVEDDPHENHPSEPPPPLGIGRSGAA